MEILAELKKLDNREICILEILMEASKPIGSWYITNRLTEKNIKTSSATVGRILNKLENMGYIEKVGFKGRVITESGRAAIVFNKYLIKLIDHQKELNKFVYPKLLVDFLTVLEARKIIESRVARMAALRASEEEIANMEKILAIQEEKQTKGEYIVNEDLNFHKAIAKASKNHIIETISDLISTLGQQTRTFENMRKAIKAMSMNPHRNILAAIKEGDPDKAEKAMLAHIDILISDVKKYHKDHQNNGSVNNFV